MVHGYTTIEQSKKLLSLGLAPGTADMYYLFFKDTGHIVNKAPFVTTGDEVRGDDLFTHVECWSFTALLELIPYTIKDDFSKCIFQMSKYDTGYQISYIREGNHHCAIWSYYEELVVDAAFKMVCWLIEQGHIKVNK